jgi:glycosyltransferase involved in cell wall biosynthesis
MTEPVIGGWMYGLADQLSAHPDITLAVATVYPGKHFKIVNVDGIKYYLLPGRLSSPYSKELEPVWQTVCDDFSPDLVHIHGTEYLHGLACMRSCSSLKYVVSIQGLMSACSRYYYAGITTTDIIANITLRDLLRFNTIFHAKKHFEASSLYEREYINRSTAVIGRTSWDHIHAKVIYPTVSYHFCNEILRNGFYNSVKWNRKNVCEHSIFLSQAAYPIKGLHQVLKAISLLTHDYPDIRVRVAGHNIIQRNTITSRLRMNGYASYLLRLVKKLGLERHLHFTGNLSEKEMIDVYLRSHLFICPSSIENSPNSVGEAQMLGVPTIASYVGGIPDMVVSEESGLLYRFEEVEMLAECIKRVFCDDFFAKHLSSRAIMCAEKRHDRKANCQQTINIYRNILN